MLQINVHKQPERCRTAVSLLIMGTTTRPEVPSATRLRSAQTRLDGVANAAYCMDTAIACKQSRAAAAAVQPEASGTLGVFLRQSLLGEDSLDSSVPPDQSAEAKLSQAHLQGAMQQVDKLQADIAGMEAVVDAVRGVPQTYTVGKLGT